jgi:hypothetical protein
MRFAIWLALGPVILMCTSALAEEPDVGMLVSKAISAGGGEGKLLTLFRIREQLNISSDPEKPGKERISVLEPPGYWWLGKKERVKDEREPATFLVWAWTLRALIDPKSKVEAIPEIVEGDKPAVGLRISESITPPMDVYFDKAENLLVRIDWRSDIHRFSDWREYDGVKYAAKCVGYKKTTGKPWYFTEIVEVERLAELPAGLER